MSSTSLSLHSNYDYCYANYEREGCGLVTNGYHNTSSLLFVLIVEVANAPLILVNSERARDAIVANENQEARDNCFPPSLPSNLTLPRKEIQQETASNRPRVALAIL